MENLMLKLKISVLWLLLLGGVSADSILRLCLPGEIEGIMAGKMDGMQISTGLLILSSLFWLIPMIMAFLTLILKHSPNRWTNFVLGIIFAVLWLVDVIGDLTKGETGPILIGLSMIVVPALIAWYAWKLPEQQA